MNSRILSLAFKLAISLLVASSLANLIGLGLVEYTGPHLNRKP